MKIKIMAAALAALFMLPMFSQTALAGAYEVVDEPADVAVATLPDSEEAPEEDSDPAPTTGGFDPEAPAEPTASPFTPSGTGTVIDRATDEDGKEFYTIKTPEENVFYLVIDRQRSTENVYFLNAVTEADLMALAEIPEKPVPVPATTIEPTPTPEVETPETPPAQEKGGNMGMMLFVIAVVLLGGAAGWYFKIYKPKQEKMGAEDDYDYSADDYDDDNGDDGLPPWDDEGGDSV